RLGVRRQQDERAVRTLLRHGLLDGVPHRKALVRGAALAGRDAAHDLGAVLLAPRGVERALLAGDPLHHHPRGLVDENAHARFPFASSTTLRAPSPMSARSEG